MIIYGIKNCDTMQKAFKWLDQKETIYTFHDYRVAGLTANHIKKWLKKSKLSQLINIKSTTYKGLNEAQKTQLENEDSAIELMIKHPTIIKRPVLESGKNLLIGFKEDQWDIVVKKPIKI